jgi:hypothetical protein
LCLSSFACQAQRLEQDSERTDLTMKLLLESSLVALVLMGELIGVAELGR